MAGKSGRQKFGIGQDAQAPSAGVQKSNVPEDELDIKVKKSGAMWPFVLGVGAGVAGTIFLVRLLSPEVKKEIVK